MTLSDISGKIVWQQKFVPDEAVSIAHLPKGIYLVCVAGQILKIVKK